MFHYSYYLVILTILPSPPLFSSHPSIILYPNYPSDQHTYQLGVSLLFWHRLRIFMSACNITSARWRNDFKHYLKIWLKLILFILHEAFYIRKITYTLHIQILENIEKEEKLLITQSPTIIIVTILVY